MNTLQIPTELLSISEYLVNSYTLNENPNHDEKGRFASGSGGSSVGAVSKKGILSKTKEDIGAIGHAISSARSKLSADGKALYNKLPRLAQRTIDGAVKLFHMIHHGGEKLHSSGVKLAEAVARSKGLSEEKTERTIRMLHYAETATRWGTNVPIAHHFIEAAAGIGGPVAFAGAKIAYYAPIASLVYIGYSMVKHALGGRNPIELIRSARQYMKEHMKEGVYNFSNLLASPYYPYPETYPMI